MMLTVKLDLERYDNAAVLKLFKQGILTSEETMRELMRRGLKDYQALIAVRSVG